MLSPNDLRMVLDKLMEELTYLETTESIKKQLLADHDRRALSLYRPNGDYDGNTNTSNRT